MTAIACQPRVFALEHISGLLVIESLDVPLNEGEILAVVF